MKKLLVFLLTCIFCCACQETLEDKAVRDAEEYTRKYCPTPVINCTRTDSVVFSRESHVYTYYISFVDAMDNRELIDEHKEEIEGMLRGSLKESTSMKQYLEAGFKFEYICRSGKNPKEILIRMKF